MRLTLATGRVNVDRMLDEITPNQLSELMAFDRIQPFGGNAESRQLALVASTLVNMQLARGSKRTELNDFMILSGTRRQQTDEEQIAICHQIAKSQNSRR